MTDKREDVAVPKIDEYLAIPLNESVEYMHPLISPDGKRSGAKLSNGAVLKIVTILEYGEGEVQKDYELVLENRIGMRTRIPINGEQFEGIKQMQQSHFGKLVLESARTQVEAWRKKHTGPGADV